MTYNKIVMIGNLARDPELKEVNSVSLLSFTLATNRRTRVKDKPQTTETCYIDVKLWGDRAVSLNQYLNKGKAVLVEGWLKQETWMAKDDTKRTRHIIVADNIVFLGGNENGAEGNSTVPVTVHNGMDIEPKIADDFDLPF